MSETEDIRAIVDGNDFHSIVEGESGRSSSVDYLDTYEDIPKETTKEFAETKEEDIKKKEETFAENERKSIELEKKEATRPACSSIEQPAANENNKSVGREERTGSTDGRNENLPAGEWNSLPLLVESLRAALELSLGSRRDDETSALPEDSGIDSEEDFRIRGSMEQALGGNSKEPELKKDLKFLEDLLLSDIETALSRLRETLERIDVAALARHGAASDPTSKIQLLRLVSSLLSRLQVPEEVPEKVTVLPSTSLSRRRRGTRHTIGVSTEELARARKWLEEERNGYQRDDVLTIAREQKDLTSPCNVAVKSEEIRDKCIKDAINQRQLLEDKNKEIRDNCAYRGIQQLEPGIDKVTGESDMYQPPYRTNGNYKENENNSEDNEERSRVSKLAAALRQRAELATSGVGKYGNNKFIVKKSKIKRANTIDIPSYLKLQESLGHESTGCVSLRRPINVGDKVSFNSINAIVPTFQPKTENDRKFLALINKNNEAPSSTPVVPFKINGKTMDMSSLTNENWNSRFSNIKTSFDKSAMPEDRGNKMSLKTRANKMFPGASEMCSDSNSNYSVPKTDSTIGFRHAPSSPFRKIEKPSSVSTSKVPPAYHRPKNAPVPTNTLKEKARMMFDRESAQPSSRSTRAEVDSQEKHGFPRPPWLDHENRANGTVTENGKLDYRSFCKQFAPFVGKSSSTDSKKMEQREKIPGVVDGKISFKIPDKHVQVHRYSPKRRESKEKFEPIRGAMVKLQERGREEMERSKTKNFTDTTLRGSSSVAVQTGINDEHQDEGRSFRVVPRISKGTNLVYNNVSVQTSGDLERPKISVSDTETGKQWKPGHYEHSDSDQTYEDRQRFILDHNQNYHTLSSDPEINGPMMSGNARQVAGEQILADPVPFQDYQKPTEDPETREYPSSFVSPNLYDYNQPDDALDAHDQKATDWPNEASTFPDDENIQNQDISPEVGIVTRYTCAIATVASSVDSPEPRSEEVAVDTSSSPSPSQWSCSRSRPPTNENTTPEDEIRRHNLLQQSLVRRLQNEVTSLNEPPARYQTSSYAQHLTVNQSKSFNHPAGQSHQRSFDQPANFDQPAGSQGANRYGQFLAPVPQKKPEPPATHSPAPMTVNRVIALREAYEQTPNSTQPKPLQKERSPIANGATHIDSSDEYLVSCATKPSRSIVLSKSESWHQLALSNSQSRATRTNVQASVSTFSHAAHPKPPKPRSPSSQKLRSKQFEASSMADSVKKMEDKIRQYFDQPDPVEHRDTLRNRRSPRLASKGMVGLSRSRTMPGLSDEKLRLSIPATQQAPLLNVNTADVDKVFDDLFEEATRTDSQC
ncbi:uncharacterized protein LOC114871304 isoform X1 [Osmia bicornis bicornis]|uniref:uncharacterized protein LOC114871304 isoform X1 n=1 Tax=Osmia bicornis bicornis TaxID=1437191 RepID=UPI001EAEB877|nr:uncharacterized protein LOC114871304 isoform X1 [Osmia bicornis bicornis]XP_046144101.1 uncharacterized protein LOC114871304 isoform X1 [Osmia bicornis bicornis]XP_046144102.1 uncharacterized protein LOC114871304 isoform X1 [Osmia bicornis bicornis]